MHRIAAVVVMAAVAGAWGQRVQPREMTGGGPGPLLRGEAEELPPPFGVTLAPGVVQEIEYDAAAGVWSAWLSNGVRVHVRPMHERQSLVEAAILMAGGSIAEDPQERGLTIAAAQALNRAAAGEFNSLRIRQMMGSRRVRLSTGARLDSIVMRIRGEPAHFEAGLELAHLVLTDGRVEEDTLSQWKSNQLMQIRGASQSAPSYLTTLLWETAVASPTSPMSPLAEHEVEAVTAGAVEDWIARHGCEWPMEVAICGDIEPGRALELAARYLGSLPARERIGPRVLADRRVCALATTPLEADVTLLTHGQEDAVTVGRVGLDGSDVDFMRRLQVASTILRQRLQDAAVEEARVALATNAMTISSGEIPGVGVFLAAAMMQRGNLDAVEAVIEEQVGKLLREGITDDELRAAKDLMIEPLEMRVVEPSHWAEQLCELTYRGRTLEDVLGASSAFSALKAEEVVAALAAAWDAGRPVRIAIRTEPIEEEVNTEAGPPAPDDAGEETPEGSGGG